MKITASFTKNFRHLSAAFLIVFSLLASQVSGQILPPSLNSMQQSATGLHASAGNHHTIACYPDGALTYYEFIDYSDPTTAVRKGAFVYNKNATTVKTFDLEESFLVADFRHFNASNIVVLCGYKNRPILVNGHYSPDQIGVVGWFNLNDLLISNTVNVEYVPVKEIYQFSKIEPFSDGQKLCVAAIGLLHDNYHQHAIFHLPDITYGTTQFNCNLFPVRNGQLLLDVIATKTYLTFSGYDFNSGGMFLRREFKNALHSPNELNKVYTFPYADESSIHSLHLAYLGNKLSRSADTIAVSTLINNPPNDVFSRHRFFELQTMTMLNAQEFRLNGKIDVVGTAYAHSAKLLGALALANPLNANMESSVVLIKPFTTTSYIGDFFYSVTRYESIDCLNYSFSDAVHFLLGGPYPWFLKNATTPTSNNGCNETDIININLLQTFPYSLDYDPLNGSIICDGIEKESEVKTASRIFECNTEFE